MNANADGSVTIICTDCKQPFKIGKDEQAFYASKEFVLPKRCKPCRVIRRQNNVSVINKGKTK